MSKEYPHLFETTMSDYTQRTYEVGLCDEYELTDEEKNVLAESKKYVREFEAEQNKRFIKCARADFEKLRDIVGMPDEAIKILKKWTTRDGDEEEYE